MRNRFDRQLELLEEKLTHMGELCEIAIANATRSLQEGDAGQAKAVIEADMEIDQMEKDIERLCLRLLLQQQPVARDLRRISAALKMITDMERIGDQTSDIAEIVISSKHNTATDIEEIGIMADAVSRMVRDSVTAYVSKNLTLARNVILADDTVDRYFEEIREQLIACIQEEKGAHGKKIFDLIMVTKYLERIGDHATNIAEWVEFSITGIHRNTEKQSDAVPGE
ncbi:MAG TPA: phosphate transport system regulatory protein PhoU [Lachnospiraceae bacterium]|nr:phosphate transport system regulatory protein PhoU [Lachnospiraceae bacterium]